LSDHRRRRYARKSSRSDTSPDGFGQLLGQAKRGSKDGRFIPGRSSFILHRYRKFHPTLAGLNANAKSSLPFGLCSTFAPLPEAASNCSASSASVFSPLIAASATFALKAWL
jgi:hypothetical protein